jgi:hypothetical protein
MDAGAVTPEEIAKHIHRIRFEAHACPFYPCEHILAETAEEIRKVIEHCAKIVEGWRYQGCAPWTGLDDLTARMVIEESAASIRREA